MPKGAILRTPIPVSEQDDGVLLLLARSEPGGPAFRVLYERYRDQVFGFLIRLLGDQATAEDVLQEAFFRVYKSADSYRTDSPFRPWLFRIARNAALNTIRSRKLLPSNLPDRLCSTSAEDVVAEVSFREDVVRLGEALDALPGDVRALLIEHHYLGLKPAELAGSWDCTERTIRNRLRSAASKLAAVMKTAPRPGGEL